MKKNYHFVKGDITDALKVAETLEKYQIDGIIHLAAESHVDRSISDPLIFCENQSIGHCYLVAGSQSSLVGKF